MGIGLGEQQQRCLCADVRRERRGEISPERATRGPEVSRRAGEEDEARAPNGEPPNGERLLPEVEPAEEGTEASPERGLKRRRMVQSPGSTGKP